MPETIKTPIASIKLFHNYFLRNPKNRSSHPKVFCKKGVLRNFTKFTGKHFLLEPLSKLNVH